ncbi:MAG: hypothetical protein AB1644_01055 [Candidatus Zixiibacteriota bacterium]
MSESFFREEPKHVTSTESAGTEKDKGEEAAPADGDALLSEDDRLAAVMSYIPFLCFVPLMNPSWKDNKRARFHARQGVVLFLVELVAVLFLIDDLAKFVFKAVLILAAALSAAGIYFALQGKSLRLPFISDLAERSKL